MEVDDRLRWLEGRVNSSLHPKGEELRSLLGDKDNRSVFLDFFNNSETRRIFIHLSPNGSGPIKASKQPPSSLSGKSLFLIKCSNSSRITKESISQDVVYSECSESPTENLELLVREVYLPLLSSHRADGIVDERLLDVLHRLMGSVQVTEGHECGELILAIPSLDVLSDWALSGSQERVMVIHVMETCVVSWMKQVKVAVHFDPDGSIFKYEDEMAGPLAEVKFWEHRLYQLQTVRDQLGSVEVLRILHQLDQAHSTYADAFVNVHRDIGKAISDTELVLMYLNTLKPWFLKLHSAFSPDTLIKLFPSLIVTLSLVWQHSGLYGISSHFHRLLRLVSNELSLKARDIIGEDILRDPSKACLTIRLALRVCSAFRGHYLDRKDWSEVVWRQHKEQRQKYQQDLMEREKDFEHSLVAGPSQGSTISSNTFHQSQVPPPHLLCSWPARNAVPFHSLNMTIERCNDLLELVQTVEHFSELSSVASLASSDGLDPILTDIYNDFNATLETFKTSTKELLSLEPNGFEKSFFDFRSSVKSLESRLSSTLLMCFEECPSLEASLRLLESFQGLISRDSVKAVLQPKLDSALDSMLSDVFHIRSILLSLVTHPPVLPNTPPTSTKLIWLKAVHHRVTTPLERVREAAPYLLEGEKGFTLRHTHSELIKEIESQWDSVINSWTKTTPQNMEERLQQSVLRKDSDTGVLAVNYDPVLEEVLREIHYFNGPVLSSSVTIPPPLRSLCSSVCSQSLHSYRSSLEVCVRLCNDLNQSLREETHKTLFTHKLQQLDNLIEEGVSNLNWTSSELPDFLAKLKGMLTISLLPSVGELLRQTKSVEDTVRSWSEVPSLDIFTDCDANDLEDITGKHRLLVEKLQSHLEASMSTIQLSAEAAFKAVEVSWESPPWMEYLGYLDRLVLVGLKQTLLQSLTTLSTRAQSYEQGGSIPPLVGVSLVLRGKEVLFDPSLTSLSTVSSVPEIVRLMLEDLLSVSQRLRRLLPSKESYFLELGGDGGVQGVIQKLTAHVDTSARQCQSLCKRFTQYRFLWEQDVIATFNSFLVGVAEPHPRRFTRPETVNRARSASHSARSRSHSARLNNSSVIHTASIVMEAVTGVSDWEFLKPDGELDKLSIHVHVPWDQQKKLKNPSLEDFDGELAVFQGIIERLGKSPDSVEVGWIRVSQLTIKDSLVSLANKWIYIYTSYLERKVLSVLSELEVFFRDIEPEVEAISDEGVESSHIMKLVTILNKVNLQQVMMDSKFGAVHRAVSILEKYKHPLPTLAKGQYEAVPQRWSLLKKRLALSKQRLAPHVQSHSAAITKDLQQFDEQVQFLHSSFLSSSCLSSTCPLTTAEAQLKDYFIKLADLQAQYKDLMELQELLQSAVVNFSLLKQFEEELNTTCKIWDERQAMGLLQAEWKSQIWTSVDVEEIRLSCDSHMTTLTSMESFSQEWDIKVTLEEEIREMLCTVPLVEGLSSLYMRPRHWKQVLKFSTNLVMLAMLLRNGAVDINTLKELTLGKLMNLKLTSHSEEVLTVVERASKDIAVEELLKNLEEVWLSMTFQFSSHIRLHGGDQAVADIGADAGRLSSTTPMSRPSSVKRKSVTSGRVSVINSTPTLKDQSLMLLQNSNAIFDALDHYQSSLQNLHGSIATSSFKDELQHWHKCLQTVEAVLSVWVKVQTLWVQLEEVLSSGEVAQYLPTQHFMFTLMDNEWRVLMKETAKAPNVLKICLQEDLLSVLEKYLSTLSQCQSTLLQYMERRRDKCSWFYFLQLEDILSLVCYASRLQILPGYMPKLVLSTSGLLFNDSLPVPMHTPPLSHHLHHSQSSPYITGIIGTNGHNLGLAEPIRCDGPVESIINHLVYSIDMTLKNQLGTAITRCLNPPGTSSGSVLKALPSLWTSSYSHQVIIVATQLLIHSHIKECLESRKSPSEDRDHLEQMANELKQLVSIVSKMIDGEDPQDLTGVPPHVMPELMTHTLDSGSNVLDSTGALRASDSHLLTGGSGRSSEQLVEMQQVTFEDEGSVSNITTSSTKLLHQRALLGGVIMVILNYKEKVRRLLSSSEDVLSSDSWQSIVHYSYASDTKSCFLNGGGASLPYGFRYTSSAPVVVSPRLEDITRHLLLTMENNSFTLVNASQTGDVCGVISDVSLVCGYPIFPLLCSSDTTRKDLFNAFRGMAATGSWLYLHNIHLLPTPLIQAVVHALTDVKTAKKLNSQTVTIGGERLRESKLDTALCIASTTTEAMQQLPSSIRSTCMYNLAPNSCGLEIESSLISNGYRSVHYLKNSLSKLCESGNLSWAQLEFVISRASEHLSSINHTPNGQPSGHTCSNIAQQVIASKIQKKFAHRTVTTPSRHRLGKAPRIKLQNISEAAEEEEEEGAEEEMSGLFSSDDEATLMSQMEEVLCLIVAIWELVVPQLASPSALKSLIVSLEEVFPGMGVSGVLRRADYACEEVSKRCPWNRDIMETLQESRATSVMYMYSENSESKCFQFIEDNILHSCLLKGLSPSPRFLRTVHSLVLQLMTRHRVVTLSGASISGRWDVIGCCLEVLKLMGLSVTVSNVPITAIGEERLLGQQQSGDGLLSHILSSMAPPPSSSYSDSSALCPLHLIVLEGDPTPLLLDTLQWMVSASGSSVLKCPNTNSHVLDHSVKFILVTPPHSPSNTQHASSIPRIVVPSSCSSWCSIVQKNLLSLDKNLHYTLSSVCNSYLPGVLEFMSPLHCQSDQDVTKGVSRSTSEEAELRLDSQDNVPDQLQLVRSMCRILQCLLADTSSPSQDTIERCFTYALIWSFGSALNKKNKRVFEKFVRGTFIAVKSMEGGTLWEHKLEGEEKMFERCLNSTKRTKDGQLFVFTSHIAATAELLKLLVDGRMSVVIDGPCGSGKTSFVLSSVSEDDQSLSVLHLLMNQQSSTGTLWTQLQEMLTWHSGTTYVPLGMEILVAVVDDVHITQENDHHSSGSVLSLIQHHIASGTVHVPNKEYRVAGTVYVCTTDSTQHPVPNELYTNVVYIYWDQYSPSELISIYSVILSSHFLPDGATPSELDPSLLSLVIQSAVQVHNKMSTVFTPSEDRRHYVFTLTTLDSIIRSLCVNLSESCSVLQLLTVWLQETYWSYAARMSSVVDREVYSECVSTTVKKYFSDHPLLPQLLSRVSSITPLDPSHQTLRTHVTQTQQHLDLTTPTPLPPLYDTITEIASRITHHLTLPHSLSPLAITGVRDLDSLVQLIASARGFTLVRPSQMCCNGLLTGSESTDAVPHVIGVEQFMSALKNVYFTAAVKNEHILVFLDDHELPDHTHLPPVYQFIKDCSISVDYTQEEKTKLTNTLRPEVCSDGADFSPTIAWRFFINRVKSNVRVLVSFSDLPVAAGRGLLGSPSILNSTHIIHQLPWDRKYLLNVAMFHLKDSSLPEDLLDSTAHLLCSLHVTVRDLSQVLQLSPPTNEQYQYLVQRFCYELDSWQSALSLTSSQLDTALHCVSSARDRVLTIQDKLKRETVVMEEKRKSYSQLLVQIGQDMAIAEEQNKLVTKQTERIQHLQQVLPEYEHIYEQYVEELKRIEHDTKDIALNLDQQSLLELRAQTKPSLAVQELLEAVIVIVKSPTTDLSWPKGAKRLMANVDRFREMLMEFSQHQEVSEVLLSTLHSYTSKSEFTEDHLIEASGGCRAAGQLCAWVLGVESYHRMLQDNIRHLDSRRTHVKASLNEYSEKLAQLQHKVQILSDRLEGLSSAVEQASIDKSQQEKVVYKMNKELRETERLVQALSLVSEGWSTERDLLSTALLHHIGTLSVGVSFITYLTAYEPHITLDIVKNHLQPCVSDMGFVTEHNHVFVGLLDQLCPKLPVPGVQQHEAVLPSVSDSFPEQGDSVSDQPDHLNPLEYSMNNEAPTSISPFHSVCSSIVMNTLNPMRSSRLTPVTNLIQTTYLELIQRSWNKWPLVSDPEGTLALGPDWTVLDASEWSHALLSSVEQAVIEGHKVVLTNLYPPFHPALLPLLQAGLHWNQPDTRPLSVEFCGRRLHISRSFQLILTTPLSSQDIPVSNNLILINIAPTNPICQEALLQTAQGIPNMFNAMEYTRVMEELSVGYDKVTKMNGRLLEHLHKMKGGESITVTVDRVEQIMAEINEVVSSLNQSFKSLEPFTEVQNMLMPVCLFGSSVYQIVRQMSLKMPWFRISMEQYQRIFSAVLEDTEVKKRWKDQEAETSSGSGKSAFKEIFERCLVRKVITASQRVLPHGDLVVLTAALILLSKCSLTPPPPPEAVLTNEIHQILYITGGEDYIGQLEESLDSSLLANLPSRPDAIPDDLFISLYSLPIDSVTLEAVRVSMFNKANEWEELLLSDATPAASLLPWKKMEEEEEIMEYSLSDLVVLKAISPSSVTAYLFQLASGYIQTLSRPVFTEILSQTDGAPLMVLYDSQDIVSQANMLGFEDTLKEVGSRSLTILNPGSLSCEEVLEQLPCVEDCAVINNLHMLLTSDALCMRLINVLRRFHQTGKRLILMVDYNSSLLQNNLVFKSQLLSLCCTISLSLICPSVLAGDQGGVVYKLCTSGEPHKYLYTLLLVLSALPDHITRDLESCGRTTCIISFLLSALHCYIQCYCVGKTPHLTTLINCMHLLTSQNNLSVEAVITNLTLFALHQYSIGDDVTNMFLRSQLLDAGSIIIPVEGLPLPVPSSSVSMERYKDHVIGVIDSLQEAPKVNIEFDSDNILSGVFRSALSPSTGY